MSLLRTLVMAILCLLWTTAPQAATYGGAPTTFSWIDPAGHTGAAWTAASGSNQCSGPSAASDDDISSELSLGFNFVYGSTVYATVRIMSNGRLQFNNRYCGYGTQSVGPPRTYPYAYPNANLARTMRVYGADIDPGQSPNPANGNPATVRYQAYTTGTCPNYAGACFVVTWSNVSEWIASNTPGGGNGSNFNFQAILHDDGSFIYQYGDSDNTTSGAAQIGWELSTSDYQVYSTGFPASGTAIRFSDPNPSLDTECGLIPATYPIYAGDKLKVEDAVRMNGFPVNKGDSSPGASVDINGDRLNVGLLLPLLDPASFPNNSSNNNADENDSPFVSSGAVYYHDIKVDDRETVSFSGGGPFHIHKLEAKEKAVINLAAGTYYIDELKLDKDVELVVTSEPVILHIGKKIDLKERVDINKFGTVTGLQIFLHQDAEFKADRDLEFTGMVYGPEAKKVEIKEDSLIHGPIIVAGEMKIDKDVSWTYSAADQLAASAISSCDELELLAEWRLDESSWNGAANEVEDSSGNGYHGVTVGNVSPLSSSPAIDSDPGTCGYATFPANTSASIYDAVDTGVDMDDDVGSVGSIAFWHYSNTAWVGGGERTLLDASTTTDYKFFYLIRLNDGRLRFGLEDSNEADQIFETSQAYAFAADEWVHLAITWDLGADRMQIYVNGNLDRSYSSSTNGSLGELGSLYLGDNRSSYHFDGSPNSANGGIDEVRIYREVLSRAEITTLMGETHDCPVNGIDHFAISHDGSAVNCQAEAITISAHQVDESLLTTYTGTASLATSTLHGDWSVVSGSGVLSNSGNGAAGYAFAAADNGQVVLGLKNTFVETVNIQVSDGSVTESAGEDPDLVFSQSGFSFATIGTQIAGKDSDQNPGAQALQLQAIRSNDQTGACEAALTGAVQVDLASECRDPIACAGQVVSVNGVGIDANNRGAVSSYQPVTLDFGSVASNSASLVLNYPDAGLIRLHARHELLLGDGSGSGNLMQGSSNEYVVRPFGFDIDFSGDRAAAFPGSLSIANDVSGSVFAAAGVAFDTTLRAVSWQLADDGDRDGVPDTGAKLTDNPVTPNFGNEVTGELAQISHSLVDPATGNSGSLSGGNNLGGFSAGAVTTQLSWNEVGIIDLGAGLTDANYLGSGADVGGNAPKLGRFTPDHFEVGISADGGVGSASFATACGSFTYLDQPFDYAAGLAAKATISAREAGGGMTLNYGDYSGAGDSNWWRLGDIAESYSDAGALTPDFSAAGHSPSTDAPSANGQVETVFSGPLSFNRPAAGELAPFNADISLSFDVLDADNVGYADGAGGNTFSQAIGFDAGAQQRHGRLRAVSAAGSELLPLALPVTAEYYTGGAFSLNTADACSQLTLATQLGLSNHQTAGGSVQAGTTSMTIGAAGSTSASLATASFSAGEAGLRFSAPGDGNVGYVDVDLDISALAAPYWLQYNWSGASASHTENPPRVRATFGIYDASPRVIQIREPWQ